MKVKIEKSQQFLTNHSFTVESIPLTDVVDASKFVNGKEMFLVSFGKQTVISGDKEEKQSFNQQVIVNGEVLMQIVNEPYRFDELIKNYRNPNPIVLVKKDYWDFFKAEGLYARIGKSIGKEENRDFNSFSSKNCFDDAKNPDYMFIQFLENKNHQKIIMNASGNLACEPMVLDYIGARLDNEAYDLDNLVEFLMKRDDIAFIAYSGSSYKNKLLHCPLKADEPDLDGIITDIPGYNADVGREEAITLIYYPKEDVIPQIMNWEIKEEDKRNRDGIYNLDGFIVREILGANPFRKVHVVEKEPEIPKRKFKRY